MVAWLDTDAKKAKVGDFVTLKNSDEPERIWEIKSIGANDLPPEQFDGYHKTKLASIRKE